MALSWAQVLGWRLARQGLDPRPPGRVVDVVARMGTLPAWPDAAAELAVGARLADGRSGDVAAALAESSVVKAYTFGGATTLMTPGQAGDYLAVRASSRQWELRSWQTHYRLAADDWPAFRVYVRDALAERPLTRAELGAALARSRRYRHLREPVAEGNDTLLKPLFWQGDVCFGPPTDGPATLQRLDGVPGWTGLPTVAAAGPRVIDAYLRVHGPARPDAIRRWVGESLGGRRRAVEQWLAELADRAVPVRVGADELVVLAEDHPDLLSARPSTAVRLLPGRDPFVMGPGTADARVVPPAHRSVVSGTANLVVHGGTVAGTWTLRRDAVAVRWFADKSRPPPVALRAEVAWLAAFLGRELVLAE